MNDFNFNDKKILLCDPDPDTVITVRNAFRDVWVKDFIATPDPEDALAQIKTVKPDLILLTMRFPDISGVQVLQKIRTMDDGAYFKTPLLMLLHKVNQTMLREACKIGLEGVVRKPIAQDKLLRFSRSVMMRPKRFVAVSHYFGPERRQQEDVHFGGEDRRKKTFHITPGKSQLDSNPVLAAPAAPSPLVDNAPTSPELTPDEVTPETQKETGDWQAELGDAPKKKQAPREDIPLTDDTAQETASPTETPKADAPVEGLKGEAPKGVPDVELEAIEDLEECLDEHKQWVNSGGKLGKQAKRPQSDFRGKDLEESHFSLAVLPLSNFDKVNCKKIDFRKADLRGSSFKATRLMEADMRVTRLAKADFRNARLDKANLLGADLAGAVFRGATLRGVNLSGANLTKTDLRGVNLSSAQGLTPDQIRRAIIDPNLLPANAVAFEGWRTPVQSHGDPW